MQTEPQKGHLWLKKFLGEWTGEMEALMGPDQPLMKSKGTESVRALGDLWIIGEGKSEMPDGNQGHMILTLGYDPATNRYPGTWIGSMMTFLWVYDGELDSTEKILTLNADGPSFTDPTVTAKYRDVHEFKSDDHRVLTSHVLGDDGKWTQFMTVNYHRTK